jgi:hypothetical protein
MVDVCVLLLHFGHRALALRTQVRPVLKTANTREWCTDEERSGELTVGSVVYSATKASAKQRSQQRARICRLFVCLLNACAATALIYMTEKLRENVSLFLCYFLRW